MVNKLKNGLLGIILAGSLAGCDITPSRMEYSTVLHEDTVVSKNFIPSRKETSSSPSVSPTLVKMGSMGIGVNGGMGICVGGFVFSSDEEEYDTPELYDISFKGKKTVFSFRGAGESDKRLYARFEEGQIVKVDYKEKYEVTSLGRSKIDNQEIMTTNFVEFVFLNAEAK